LFKIAMQGVSLWHFNVYMYYNLNWFIPFIFLLNFLIFLLSALLMMISTGLKFFIHSCIGKKSTIFTFLTSFFYSPSSVSDLSLAWSVFHNICICIGSIFHIWEKTWGLWLSESG
jgi:hypothetical protein